MLALLAPLALLLAAAATAAAAPAAAQTPAPAPAPAAAATPRPINCLGAERLEDDVFEIPFARGGATIGEAARAPLGAAVALARAEPGRAVCVLGHADDGGGSQSNVRLAARRAGAVAAELAARGVARERIRGEARVASFRRRTEQAPGRNALIVVLPAED